MYGLLNIKTRLGEGGTGGQFALQWIFKFEFFFFSSHECGTKKKNLKFKINSKVRRTKDFLTSRGIQFFVLFSSCVQFS